MTGWVGDVLPIAAAVAAILLLRVLAWAALRRGGRLLRRAVDRAAGSSLWARSHPLRALVAARFPRLWRAIRARVDPHAVTGLPLTLLVVAALYAAALLGGLVEEVVEADEIVALDSRTAALVGALRTPVTVAVLAWLTRLGDMATLTAVAIVATLFLWADRRTAFILPLWVTIAGSQATTWLGKFGFDRARPDFATEVTALSPSFPSAHAAGAMAVFGFVGYAIVRDRRWPRARFEIGFWTAILVGLIGFSRIALSVHYLSDVLAGFLVGLFWLLVGVALAEIRRPPVSPDSATRPSCAG